MIRKSVSLITMLALAALFMSITSFVQARERDDDDDDDDDVECPCNYWAATRFASRRVKAIGGSFEITDCNFEDTDFHLNIEADNDDQGLCDIKFQAEIELQAEDPNEGGDVGIDEPMCEYIFQCGGVGPGSGSSPVDPLIDSFVLAYEQTITEEEFEACRSQIMAISRRKYDQQCVVGD